MRDAKRSKDLRTRRAILEILKRQGPSDASALAEELEVSAMAVRQHLYALQEEKLVDHITEPRPVGRPAKLWRVTREADRFFPDGHSDLAADLIGAMKEAFGDKGVAQLLAVRSRDQIAAYRKRIDGNASLKARLTALAEIRTEEGYMAAVTQEGKGRYLFVESHCPICVAATSCTGLCAQELQVFRAVLGPDIEIERTDHILAGARRCAYDVRKAG